MASNLNTFKTVNAVLSTDNAVVYSAPFGVTSIVLMAQIANVTANPEEVTFSHYNTGTTDETELVKEYTIPSNDAASVITGKLVLESGNSVKAIASANNTLKITMSVLETLNA